MSGFERLHPAIQHHVVNSLGWRSLRPLQERAIAPVLEGRHALLVAPTAGGKTEAAVLPVLSRMLSENWDGLSVLYVCPIKALLNNLEPRLRGYAELVGRRASVWHGDVSATARRRILREPPDVLLTTPESIEVILTSTRTDHRSFFSTVRCIIVDELHAFAGDDRGWHLLCVAERVSRLAGRDLQRLGLSATIGNPVELLDWLAGSSTGAREVVSPAASTTEMRTVSPATDADVTLDYVGTLDNAATMISRLYRGEKRLVFCDSRARVEQLAHALRVHGANVFVSHSSLSVDERQQAEAAFATARDAVIIATSTLELGIDVGDLDHVIQIDAPGTVASFLQRLGRTGRRAGTRRNCLFLATNQSAFLQAAGLLDLWAAGFVEPITPPPLPFHILAQQIMALALQERGIGRHTWKEWLGGLPVFVEMGRDSDAVIEHMLHSEILVEDAGIFGFGPEGERSYGWRNFMELMAVFTSDPLIVVRHGRDDLGQVHPLTFTVPKEQQAVLLLAGRSWSVKHVDWRQRVAYVEPSDQRGRSQWLGAPRALHFEQCRAVRRVLAGAAPMVHLTTRAETHLDDAREDFAWVDDGATTVVRDAGGDLTWWTFAGLYANEALHAAARDSIGPSGTPDNFSVPLPPDTSREAFRKFSDSLNAQRIVDEMAIADEVLDGLKFSNCLPKALSVRELRIRMGSVPSISACLGEPKTWVV